jgi:hypothetical protein
MNKLLMIAAIFMTGCMATTWTKPDAEPGALYQDQRECKYEAVKAVPDNGMGSGMMIGYERASVERMCMELRGWRRQ